MKDYPRYWEIICQAGVIGVCCEENPGDDMLLHAAKEDRVVAFGVLTKEQYEKFGDDGWTEPISTVRFRPRVFERLELHQTIGPVTVPKLPDRPSDMPWTFCQENPYWLSNTINALNMFSVVDIHWENDWHLSNETGEPSGKWDVSIVTSQNKEFKTRHHDLKEALWYVTELANAKETEDWDRRAADRQAALAKLNDREKRLLGLEP